MINKTSYLIALLIMSSFMFAGCSAVETIFKAGMWWAFFLVALAVFIFIYIVAKIRKK